VLVLGYAGWSDGGDAATTAAKSLMSQFEMSRYACIDTEDYLDFTVVRPHTRIGDGEQREIIWPNHEFFSARFEGRGSDVLVGLGVEPHLRWKSYARTVVELVRAARVRLVVLLGAYLDEVIYSQPVQVSAYASNPELFADVDLAMPTYEGPTGIMGVLADALRGEQISTISLWGRIPHYVPTKPNARGALALLNALQRVAGLRLELSTLEKEAADFDARVSELITADPDLAAYVRELKRRVFSS
jgi:proteasome assembly chaperone (PAC2) family protein